MKVNNKGFAISAILYGVSILIIVLLMLFVKTMRTDNSNSKYYSEVIEKELNACSTEMKNYRECVSDNDCKDKFKYYVECYCKKIYNDTTNCDSTKIYTIMNFD